MKVLLLVVALVLAVAVAKPMPRLRNDQRWSLRTDPTARMLAVGFATLPESLDDVDSFAKKQFPTLIGAANKTSPLAAGELARLDVLIVALRERNHPGDAALAHRLAGELACECCTWVVGQLYSKLADGGCSLAEPAFAAVCAAIPYVDVAVDVCVWVLNWGCGKLASYIENGVQSPTELCNDVFDDCCASSASSSSY